MDLPIEGLPETPVSSRGRLMIPLLVLLGGVLGCALSIGLLRWSDMQRREHEAHAERERLAQLERDAKKPADLEGGSIVPPTPTLDHLGRANEQFRELHRLHRGEAVAKTTPVVVVNGDELVLHFRGAREVVSYLPPLFHELKAYAHVPLAAYLASGLNGSAELTKLADRMNELSEELKKRDYPPEVKARQKKLLDETAAFLEVCRKTWSDKKPQVDDKMRHEFAAKLRTPIAENVKETAKIQIDALDAQMSKWRKSTMTEAEWKQLRVIVVGSAMPRVKNLAVQYFAWLLNEPVDDRLSKRIIYAEGLFDESKALNLLGTHIVDEDIGRAFFQEKTRMRRDLLGDDAEAILEKMKK